MKSIIILSFITSLLLAQTERVIISINGLENIGLNDDYVNYVQYSKRILALDLEKTVSHMIGEKYLISIDFNAYESINSTKYFNRDSLDEIINEKKSKYSDENLVAVPLGKDYAEIQKIIIG